ncbi:MAG: Lrp/AsnC family transcriptional regulator, partial [Gammaproteobacteria bacterium]|nr:Lrp/AsnC family transcriptional regulator [Gammaproteobacteria bacterium]
MIKLDKYDVEILKTLQRDGRITNQKLAERVSLSTAPCWRRVNRLEQNGAIEGYVALANRQQLG